MGEKKRKPSHKITIFSIPNLEQKNNRASGLNSKVLKPAPLKIKIVSYNFTRQNGTLDNIKLHVAKSQNAIHKTQEAKNMARKIRVGLLTIGDGRDFLKADLDVYNAKYQKQVKEALEGEGFEVLAVDTVIDSNTLGVNTGK